MPSGSHEVLIDFQRFGQQAHRTIGLNDAEEQRPFVTAGTGTEGRFGTDQRNHLPGCGVGCRSSGPPSNLDILELDGRNAPVARYQAGVELNVVQG